MPGEPFGVPEAPAQEGEGPNRDDGDGERTERRSFGGAEKKPGGGGHESERGEFGSGTEERGAEKAEDVLCGHSVRKPVPPARTS